MKKWILKAIVQKTISFMPYRYHINRLFQKHITKGLELNTEHFSYKIEHAKDHIDYLVQYKKTTQVTCLELGTGWYPIVPIALFLSDARQIYTADISSHLSKKTIADTLQKYIDWDNKSKIQDFLPLVNPTKWQQLLDCHQNINQLSLEDLLTTFRIKPIVGDARQLDFADNSVEFICSNNTFEHIYPDVLKGILQEFKRIIKKDGGLMSHFIDMSDHFAHFDTSINIYNFLQFSPKAWNRIDNSIQPQNRWRWNDYQNLYQELDIEMTEEQVREGSLEQLQEIAVHESFGHLSSKEQAISHGYMVSFFV